MSDDIKWCPTQNGKLDGYTPEWRANDGEKWQRIPAARTLGPGLPYPRWGGGVLETIGLCGYAQAQALAWCFATHAAGEGKDIQVRVAEYEIVYDIKARCVEITPQEDK